MTDKIMAGTENWFEARKKGIGASDIPVICGLNPWRTPLELWCDKTGRAAPKETNDAMWLGTKMEPIIAEFFTRKFDFAVSDDVSQVLHIHPEIPWAFATPDYGLKEIVDEPVNEGDGLLECKNTSYKGLAQWKEEVPFWAQAQLQWQLGVVGRRWGYIAGLVGAAELIAEPFAYSTEIFAQLHELAEKFWGLVQTDTPPAASYNDADIVEHIIGKRVKGLIDLPAEAYPLVQEYRKYKRLNDNLRKEFKEAENEFKAVKNRIIQAVGPFDMAKFDGGEFKFTRVEVKPYINKGCKYTKVTAKFTDAEEVDDEE